MFIPTSMQTELAAWNNGNGIDLETWIGCSGNFSLAIGYTAIFWPEFVEIDGYLVRQGTKPESNASYAEQAGSSRIKTEATFNHIHLADLHYQGCADCTPDKLLALGHTLKEIHEAKLKWQFPDRPCRVELTVPRDSADLQDYQLTFWQVSHESTI